MTESEMRDRERMRERRREKARMKAKQDRKEDRERCPPEREREKNERTEFVAAHSRQPLVFQQLNMAYGVILCNTTPRAAAAPSFVSVSR